MHDKHEQIKRDVIKSNHKQTEKTRRQKNQCDRSGRRSLEDEREEMEVVWMKGGRQFHSVGIHHGHDRQPVTHQILTLQ